MMYENWTTSQKKRWLFAWLTFALVFTFLDIGMVLVLADISQITKQIKMIIELTISAPISACITMQIYKRYLLPHFPDDHRSS